MLVEYAIVRLAALRRLFPAFERLERMATGRDGAYMARVLSGTVFEPEFFTLSARSAVETSIPLVLRLINEGSLRMKALFAARVAEAFPQWRDIFVIRWEMEEIKAALRYLTFGGAGMEKRFRFESYIIPHAGRDVWNAHMKPAEFAAALGKVHHPLAPAMDTKAFAADPARAELDMERYLFTGYLEARAAPWPACREYFLGQLDMINAKNAWLARAPGDKPTALEGLYIAGGGRIGRDDFSAIATLSPERAAIGLIQERMGLTLDPVKLDSPYGLSTAIKNALLKRYRSSRISEPGGVWAFFLFAEELDAMIADVKNAVYCGATCSTVDVVSHRFIGASAR